MTGSKWDGKISNLNISEQAFPELYHELSQMQHKARSDRLRALALLGLYSLRFSGNIGFLSNRVPIFNLHSIKPSQCRLMKS